MQAFKPSRRFPLTADPSPTRRTSRATSISGSNLWAAATRSRSRRTPPRIGSRTGRRTAAVSRFGRSAAAAGFSWSPRQGDTNSASPSLATGRAGHRTDRGSCSDQGGSIAADYCMWWGRRAGHPDKFEPPTLIRRRTSMRETLKVPMPGIPTGACRFSPNPPESFDSRLSILTMERPASLRSAMPRNRSFAIWG